MPPTTTSTSFAPEIWNLITERLSKTDINSLSRTSRSFLDHFRPILFRRMNLYSEDPSEALDFLSKDTEIAKFVQILCLSYEYASRDSPTRDLGRCLSALSNMLSLKSLHMIGSVFKDELDQAAFVQRVIQRKLPIEDFTFWDFGRELPGHELPLPHLTSFTWKSNKDSPGETLYHD